MTSMRRSLHVFTTFGMLKINYICFQSYMTILKALIFTCTNRNNFTYFGIFVNFGWISLLYIHVSNKFNPNIVKHLMFEESVIIWEADKNVCMKGKPSMKNQNNIVFAELNLIFVEIYFSNYWYLPVNTLPSQTISCYPSDSLSYD